MDDTDDWSGNLLGIGIPFADYMITGRKGPDMPILGNVHPKVRL